ncbi:hypothetical protein E3N88_39136 [Mikania micrantha]|uniref:Uncharacterized protein n=1 Tax=Mikania micrantha TaxID=192012 RepID=A0A5N6LVX8_9ASTR|nr:hypothetical protein E3N88_39136 [Mikania micrantha]
MSGYQHVIVFILEEVSHLMLFFSSSVQSTCSSDRSVDDLRSDALVYSEGVCLSAYQILDFSAVDCRVKVVKALSWFELVVSCQRFVQSLFTTELVAVYCRKEVALKWQVSDTFMRFCLGLSPCFSLSRSVSSEMVRALGSIPERVLDLNLEVMRYSHAGGIFSTRPPTRVLAPAVYPFPQPGVDSHTKWVASGTKQLRQGLHLGHKKSTAGPNKAAAALRPGHRGSVPGLHSRSCSGRTRAAPSLTRAAQGLFSCVRSDLSV